MENKLEQLLNSLIEKGWKPFGRYKEIFRTDYYEYYVAEEHGFGKRLYLRNLVSKESGLWQFVCENKLFPKNRGYKRENDEGNGLIYYCDEYQYFLIESALRDEGELEEFLLSNIKVEGEEQRHR